MGRNIYIVIAGIVLDFFFRLIIQIILAAKFGAGVQMDAYLVALAIPVLLLSVLVNPLHQSFIPVFSEYRERTKDKDSGIIISSLFNLIFLVLFFICILAVFNSQFSISLIAPGFRNDPSLLNLTSQLFKLICFIVFLGILSGLLAGVYHSYQRFFVPSFIPSIRGLLVLGVVLIFSKEIGIFSLAAGNLFAWAVGLAIMFLILFKDDVHYKFVFNLNHPAIKKMARLFVPLVLAALLPQSYILIDRYLASYLSSGSISYLSYAFNIVQFPLFISASIITVIFPLLSQYKAKGKLQEFNSTLKQAVKFTAYLVIPAALGIGIIRTPLVRLLYERGEFTPQATSATALTLACYLPWLVAYALRGVFIAAFYALGNIKIPIKIGLISVSVKIILSLMLIKYFTYFGLAIASSVAFVVNILFLWISFNRLKQSNQLLKAVNNS